MGSGTRNERGRRGRGGQHPMKGRKKLSCPVGFARYLHLCLHVDFVKFQTTVHPQVEKRLFILWTKLGERTFRYPGPTFSPSGARHLLHYTSIHNIICRTACRTNCRLFSIGQITQFFFPHTNAVPRATLVVLRKDCFPERPSPAIRIQTPYFQTRMALLHAMCANMPLLFDSPKRSLR